MYFTLSTLISTGLLLAWIRNHGNVITHIADPTVPEVSQTYALVVVAFSNVLNTVWFGPATSKYVTWQLDVSHCLTCSTGSRQRDLNWKNRRKKMPVMPTSAFFETVVLASLTVPTGVDGNEGAEGAIRQDARVQCAC